MAAPISKPIFCTSVRKVEPIGQDCLRIYCAIERNGTWEDRVVLEMPITGVISSNKFVMAAVREMFTGMEIGEVDEKMVAH